ncbi:MAG: hypothetical protein H7251_15215 [Acetobacteraceae bacterium]|nr:hypothetical protein [Acetobacteraceae bacterium]
MGWDMWHEEPAVIVSSHLVRRSDRQPELLVDAEAYDLLSLLGLVPHIQAQLLARHLRGDIDGYPARLWSVAFSSLNRAGGALVRAC